ncbi:hypothetical protein AMJ85_08620, partial [candidate division BRC1 bacterium SM23_51]
EQYQRKRLGEVSRGTTNKEIVYLLRLLRLNGFVVPKPFPKRGRATEQRAFTPDELQRFFKACPERLKPLYALMLATGARLAELVPSDQSTHVVLLKTEVDLAAKRIVIRSAKTRSNTPGKVRVLQIPEDLAPMLEKWMREVDGPHVFRPLPNSHRDFDCILRKAGIPKADELGRKVTAHSFRHTYATFMAEATGHNPFVLKEILGHKRLSMTERYCHPTAASLPPPLKTIGPLLDGETHVMGPCKILEIEPRSGTQAQ